MKIRLWILMKVNFCIIHALASLETRLRLFGFLVFVKILSAPFHRRLCRWLLGYLAYSYSYSYFCFYLSPALLIFLESLTLIVVSAAYDFSVCVAKTYKTINFFIIIYFIVKINKASFYKIIEQLCYYFLIDVLYYYNYNVILIYY